MKKISNSKNPKDKSEKRKENTVVVPQKSTLPIFLSNVKKSYEISLRNHTEEQLLGRIIGLLKDSFIAKLNPPSKKAVELAKKTILSSFEITLQEMLAKQYDTNFEETEKESSEIEKLAIINDPYYIQNIINDKEIPNGIKTAIKNAISNFTEKKLEEFHISREDFEEYLRDPKSKTLTIRKDEDIIEENIEVLSKPENEPSPTKKSQKKKKSKQSSSIKSNNKNNVEDPTPTPPTDSKEETSFFEQVQGFTNNFSYLIIGDADSLNQRHSIKFSNIENYATYMAFQQSLYEYQERTGNSELDIINKILSNNLDEFSKINPDFQKILEARKDVIERTKKISEDYSPSI